MFVVARVVGRVGAVVVRELLSKGEKVKVIVRDSLKGAEWSKHGAAVTEGSLDDVKFLAGALRGATGFFAALPLSWQTTRESPTVLSSMESASSRTGS